MDNNDLRMDSTSVPGELAEGSPEVHEDLLADAKAQWMFGDWVSLSCRSLKDIAKDPNRAKVALLIASAHLQCGNQIGGEAAARQALQWGCSPKAVSRILISGVYNSLARISALDDDAKAMSSHFQESLSIAGGKSAQLAANSRMLSELKSLGLKHIENYSLEDYSREKRAADSDALEDRFRVASVIAQPASTEGRFNRRGYEYYKSLGGIEDKGPSVVPFVLIDSKSLPRSGLHYFKSIMEGVLWKRFSFCEWYQEVGCCKAMPCAVTSFSRSSAEDHTPRVRLIKSHDFELNDPVFPSGGVIVRPVFYRESIFQLTSWFLLDQLNLYRPELSQNGINLNQVFLRHDPEVLLDAYSVIDKNYKGNTVGQLEDWIKKKKEYMKGFASKWMAADKRETNGVDLVHYDKINSYAVSLLKQFEGGFDADTKKRFRQFEGSVGNTFFPRKDPFKLKSLKVSEYVEDNRKVFELHSEELDRHLKSII